MSTISLVLLAAGGSSRFKRQVKKQWLYISEQPLWQFVADSFIKQKIFSNIIIATSEDEINYMKKFGDYNFTVGGNTRQESLKNALKLVDTEYVMVSDVARCCIDKNLIERLLQQKETYDVVVPFLHVNDTIVYKNETINREEVKRVQTPQLSKTSILKQALQSDTLYTDESSAIVAIGGKRGFVEGSKNAHKLTFAHDIASLSCLKPPREVTLSGIGFDVHKFDDTKSYIMLCGVAIECGYGFEAHSDGDVAIHALIDAILGASGMGDIGELFPDTDQQYKGIDSKKLLQEVLKRICNYGFELLHVDITIIAQQPKLLPYKQMFQTTLATLLNIAPIHVNIKATTTEKLGFVGRNEGVAVEATANLTYFNWTKGTQD